jgi:hypothetical protein
VCRLQWRQVLSFQRRVHNTPGQNTSGSARGGGVRRLEKKTPRRIGQGELSGLLLHRKPAQGIGNTLDHPARAGCDLLHNSLDWLSRTALSHYLYSFQGFEK